MFEEKQNQKQIKTKQIIQTTKLICHIFIGHRINIYQQERWLNFRGNRCG